jgi:hypothetical protein
MLAPVSEFPRKPANLQPQFPKALDDLEKQHYVVPEFKIEIVTVHRKDTAEALVAAENLNSYLLRTAATQVDTAELQSFEQDLLAEMLRMRQLPLARSASHLAPNSECKLEHPSGYKLLLRSGEVAQLLRPVDRFLLVLE